MKLFLSYPSAERSTAERLALALEAEGHEVFFDRSDLDAGQAFHQRLREAIQEADAMVFLVTPAAVAPGSYTLAELDIARGRWRRPAGHVLPVLLAPTPIASLPPYLTAVTLLQPQGELVAETVAAVERLAVASGRRTRRRIAVGVAAVVAVLLLAGGGVLVMQLQHGRAAAAALQRDEAAAAQAMQLCNDGSHEAALQQLGELAAHQPPAAAVIALRADCAMRWLREMRASRGDGVKRSFDEQVAVVQPVLLQALAAGAQGARAADLRAHLGWGEFLRRREGSGSADPVPHWRRALGDDPGNVYAHAMWANSLLPGGLAEARRHFDAAVASGRDREFVRRLQFGGALGGGDDATAYAVAVADAMRRGSEAVSSAQRSRLWNYAFGTRMFDADLRRTLFAALPSKDLLATFDWLFPAAESRDATGAIGRFDKALLQANAGDKAAALAGLEALERELRAQREGGRLLDQTQQALTALRKP